MKIFIVCSRLGYGGAEHVAMMWANGFVEKGHIVKLISDLQKDITFPVNPKVEICNFISTFDSKNKKWISAVKNLRKLAKEEKPDVIITVMRLCSLVAKIATLGMGIPIVATEHNAYEWPASNPMPLQARLFKFYLSRFFKKVTVLTETDKTLIGKRLSNVFVMPNPLSLEPMEMLPERENNILAVGRLDAWKVKGFDVLIRAWASVVSSLEFLVSTEGWKLQIAGMGSDENISNLKQLCKENGVEDSVEFLGFRKDVEKLYQNASIFVLSSRYEGFGLVLIEAMSQGCACVACDYKGRQSEILNPTQDQTFETRNLNQETRNRNFEACDNGILCEPDNVESLASGIQKMIVDNGYRENVRRNAVERSKHYTIEKIVTRWEQLFTSIFS